MKKKARRILRKVLKVLTQAVLKKHNPTVIALVGKSSTGVPREILYQILHNHFPTRRNIESPEAEFVIPLTIIGADYYPQDLLDWAELILKTVLQLLILPRHSNILILEMNTELSEILDYWLELTHPEYIIICGEHPTSKHLNQTKIFEINKSDTTETKSAKEIALEIGSELGLSKETLKNEFSQLALPEPRIRLLPGNRGNFIVDATYKYFPPLEQSINEIVNALSGDKTWIDSKEDWEAAKNKNTDVLIIRGPRKKLLPILEEACLNPLKT